jgi:adenine deaminase
MGISPIAAIKMATIQPARCYGLRRTGAVAPGFDADLVVRDSLKEFNAQKVFYKGQLIDNMLRIKPEACPPELMDTVHIGDIDPSKLIIRLDKKDGKKQPWPVMEMIPGQI